MPPALRLKPFLPSLLGPEHPVVASGPLFKALSWEEVIDDDEWQQPAAGSRDKARRTEPGRPRGESGNLHSLTHRDTRTKSYRHTISTGRLHTFVSVERVSLPLIQPCYYYSFLHLLNRRQLEGNHPRRRGYRGQKHNRERDNFWLI